MAIQWKWDEKCGEMVFGRGEDAIRVNLYTGNCLLIMLKEEGTGHYNLWSFWADRDHMYNCLGLSKDCKDNIYGRETPVEIHLDTTKCRNSRYIIPAIIRAFETVTIITERMPKIDAEGGGEDGC